MTGRRVGMKSKKCTGSTKLNSKLQTAPIFVLMEIKCTKKELDIFKKVAEAAAELGFPCYLIGGFVRDKIIGRPTKDADIVCVGDGIELAHKVAARFHPRPPVSFFKNFGTAQIKLEDWEIEFVG